MSIIYKILIEEKREKFLMAKKANDYFWLRENKKSYPQAVDKLSTGYLSIYKIYIILHKKMLSSGYEPSLWFAWVFPHCN